MGMRAGEAGEAPSGGHQRIGRSTHEETTLSETRRKYRKFTAQQKLELVMAAIDRCTREIVAWHLQTRCRAKEAIGLIERAATERGIPPGTLTLGTDNGSAFTARALQGRPGRPGDHAPPRRLPRPREPSVHRVLVRQAQGALRLAARVRDPRRS
jgi:transposase InsO family protein